MFVFCKAGMFPAVCVEVLDDSTIVLKIVYIMYMFIKIAEKYIDISLVFPEIFMEKQEKYLLVYISK